MESAGNEDQLYLSTVDSSFLIYELELIQFIPDCWED